MAYLQGYVDYFRNLSATTVLGSTQISKNVCSILKIANEKTGEKLMKIKENKRYQKAN